jgi:hypothetical protein
MGWTLPSAYAKMPLLATIVGLETRREAMDQHSEPSGPGITKTAVLVIFVILGVGVALLIPAVQKARDDARRCLCTNHMMQIGVALNNYATANKGHFPPGAVCSTANLKADSANPWADAKLTSKGASGTSWILSLLPHIEGNDRFNSWDFGFGVSGGNNPAIASQDVNRAVSPQDVPTFYCPTRRVGFRPGIDGAMMLNPKWTAGGTDYGGCAGRHRAFSTDNDQSVILPTADDRLPLCFVPGVDLTDVAYQIRGDVSGATATCEAKRGFGIFGGVNVSINMNGVEDGLTNTVMIGELQRIVEKTPTGPFTASSGPILSHDGWAIGGSPTLFSTGCPYPADVKTKTPMNNGYFASPGSDHVGGTNFGLGDASVRFLPTTIDPNIFALLGSMADDVRSPRLDD